LIGAASRAQNFGTGIAWGVGGRTVV
jgi:hypothetical protein